MKDAGKAPRIILIALVTCIAICAIWLALTFDF